MIVYNDIKRQFVNDVKDNSIDDKILEAIRIRGLTAGHEKEYSSWQNSMQFMRKIVDDPGCTQYRPIHNCDIATHICILTMFQVLVLLL